MHLFQFTFDMKKEIKGKNDSSCWRSLRKYVYNKYIFPLSGLSPRTVPWASWVTIQLSDQTPLHPGALNPPTMEELPSRASLTWGSGTNETGHHRLVGPAKPTPDPIPGHCLTLHPSSIAAATEGYSDPFWRTARRNCRPSSMSSTERSPRCPLTPGKTDPWVASEVDLDPLNIEHDGTHWRHLAVPCPRAGTARISANLPTVFEVVWCSDLKGNSSDRSRILSSLDGLNFPGKRREKINLRTIIMWANWWTTNCI